jgi:hypothetical protein
MKHNEHETGAESRKEGCRTVDGAGEHRGQDESEDGIEGRLLRQKATVAATDDDERHKEHDDSPEADLKEGKACHFSS